MIRSLHTRRFLCLTVHNFGILQIWLILVGKEEGTPAGISVVEGYHVGGCQRGPKTAKPHKLLGKKAKSYGK